MVDLPRLYDREALAWAAGFFDGEGSFGFTVANRRAAGVQGVVWCKVTQVRREPLDRFRDAVQLGVVNGPYAPRSNKNQPTYLYTATSYQAIQQVVCSLWNWLSEPKREQIHAAMCIANNWFLYESPAGPPRWRPKVTRT